MLIGVLGGLALVGAVLLWVTDVITMPVFLGIVVVTAIVEFAAVIALQRRASRRQAQSHEQTTRGTTSTLDGDSPHTRYGYEPLDGRDPVVGHDPDGDTRR